VAPPAQAAARGTAAVRLAQTTGTRFYDSQQIVYSREPGTRAYYQFNSWTERPSRRIHKLLSERLEHAGVLRANAGATLHVHVEELFHDAVATPGTAKVRLNAELTDASGARIAQRHFSGSAPVATYDAPGAVRAFGEALGPMLDDVVAWAAASIK
jgi:ABC-type uncharacterized transport system auxiliary subunit